MQQGKHGPIPDHYGHAWFVAWLPNFAKCWLYHPLQIYSPSIGAVTGKSSCPVCGKIYES